MLTGSKQSSCLHSLCTWLPCIGLWVDFVRLLQSFLQITGELLKAPLADRLKVDFKELCLLTHFLVADRACEVVDTPGFVQGSEYISTDDTVADVTKVAKQLVVVGLTVRKPLLLVVPVAQERLFTLSAYEVLDVPVLAQCSDHTLLNGPSASTANGDAHLVMTAEAVQVPFYFTCLCSQLHTASGAVEMVWVVGFTAELQRHVINDPVALVADVFATGCSLFLRIALMTESSSSILDETLVSQRDSANLTLEALGVPVVIHGFDNSANDELAALAAAGGEKDMEVMLAVLAALELVEDTFGKWPEALATDKACLVPHFTMGVDNLLVGLKPVPTTGASHRFERHQEVCLRFILHLQSRHC